MTRDLDPTQPWTHPVTSDPNWQNEGWTAASVLNDRDLARFSGLTDPFTPSGRERYDDYKAQGVHPKEFLDQQKQKVLEDMYSSTVDEMPDDVRDWLAQRSSPLLDHPDVPPGEDDGRY